VEKFGQEVADVVAEVTDDKTLAKEERKQQQVDKAPYKSKKAKLVKLADKVYIVHKDLQLERPGKGNPSGME
jgi:guanosine-3',5'-bis(diphosphate) 3'-pyrophosphohydrolase